MLQKLNERIQGLVAWIVISLVGVTFTLFGVDYYMQSHHESSAQVDVNGQPISKQAFELSYRRIRQSRSPSQMTATSDNQLKQQLLNEMILNSVTVQSARSNGFEVSSSQADSAIINIAQFQEEGSFSNSRYTQALSGAFFTPESFQKEVRQGMLMNQQRFAFIGTSFALPADIDRFVKLYMQTRDYDYLQIPALAFLKQAKVSEHDITTYYQQNRSAFLAPEEISIAYIRLSMQDIKKSITLSESQTRRYYDENKTAGNKPYADIKADIQDQLRTELAQTKYAEILDKLSDLSYQTPDSLTPVAGLLKLKVEVSGLFSRHGGNTPLLKNKQIIRGAFAHDVLELGNNSDPIQIDNDTVVVLRVNQHIPAAEKRWVDVKQLIVNKLAAKQSIAAAMQIGKALLSTAYPLSQREELIRKNSLKWHAVKKSGRDTDAVPTAINALAFNLPRGGDKGGVGLLDGDYVIVFLNAINDGGLALIDKEQQHSITQQIEANYGVMDYELYINSLMSKADIVKH